MKVLVKLTLLAVFTISTLFVSAVSAQQPLTEAQMDSMREHSSLFKAPVRLSKSSINGSRDWLQFAGNAARTGNAGVPVSVGGNSRVVEPVPIDATPGGPALIEGRNIYAAFESGVVVRVDGVTGAELWRTDNVGSVLSPAISGNTLLVVRGNVITALNKATGSVLWSQTAAHPIVSHVLVGADGHPVVHAAGPGNQILKFNIGTGAELAAAFSNYSSDLAEADGVVYAATYPRNTGILGDLLWHNTNLAVTSTVELNSAWSFSSVTTQRLTHFAVNNGRLYTVSNRGSGALHTSEITRVNTTSREAEELYTLVNTQIGVPTSVYGGKVYYAHDSETNNGTDGVIVLDALNFNNISVFRNRGLGPVTHSTIAIGSNGVLVVGSDDGVLHFLTQSGGDHQNPISLSGSPLGAIALGDSLIACTDQVGNLHIVRHPALVGGAQNTPPSVANPLADIVLNADQGIKVSLTGTFTDTDGDPLVYSASSSNSGVAAVSIDEESLTINAISPGTTTVTVTANDGNGGVATDQFVITVEPSMAIVTFSLPHIAATQGGSLIIPVNSESDSLITGARLVFEYESSRVRVDSVKLSSVAIGAGFLLTENPNPAITNTTPGTDGAHLAVLVTSGNGLAGTYALLNVFCTVVGDTGTTVVGLNTSVVSAATSSGDLLPGDISLSNGSVVVGQAKISFSGRVKYRETSRFLPDVNVEITDASNANQLALTDADGAYSFSGVEPGTLSIGFSSGPNASSAIDLSDAVAVLEYIALLRSFSPEEKRAANVAGDTSGDPSLEDARAIMRFLALLNGTGRTGQWQSFNRTNIVVDGTTFVDSISYSGDIDASFGASEPLAKGSNILASSESANTSLTLMVSDASAQPDSATVLEVLLSTPGEMVNAVLFVVTFDSTQFAPDSIVAGNDATGFLPTFNMDPDLSKLSDLPEGTNDALVAIFATGTSPVRGDSLGLLKVYGRAIGEPGSTSVMTLLQTETTLQVGTPSELFKGEAIAVVPGIFEIVGTTTGVGERRDQDKFDSVIPEEFALHQNYPNPFNPSTTIRFSIPEARSVTLKVYNLMGQEVATLLENSKRAAGRHTLQFDAHNLPSGIYFYRLWAGNFSGMRRMTLLK